MVHMNEYGCELLRSLFVTQHEYRETHSSPLKLSLTTSSAYLGRFEVQPQ